MKPQFPQFNPPADAQKRKAVKPVICYPVDGLPKPDLASYRSARAGWKKTGEVLPERLPEKKGPAAPASE